MSSQQTPDSFAYLENMAGNIGGKDIQTAHERKIGPFNRLHPKVRKERMKYGHKYPTVNSINCCLPEYFIVIRCGGVLDS